MMVALLLWIAACKPPLAVDSATPVDDTEGDTALDTADTTIIDDSGPPPEEDGDGDGYLVSAGDCDDADAERHPGAVEALDGVDGDCDGQVDNGAAEAFSGATRTDGSGASFGQSFAAALASSGQPLLAVGAPGDTGRVFVFDGAAVGEGTAALDARYTLDGSAAGSDFGATVLLAPLDGDVYGELLVGAPSAGGGSGAVYVLDGARISGGGSGAAESVAHLVEGDTAGTSAFGRGMAVGNDMAWIGAPGESLGRGAIYGFDSAALARGTVSTADEGVRVLGEGSEIGVGFALLMMDWNADGSPDLVVTSPGSAGVGFEPGAGRVFVFDADILPTLTDESDTSAATAAFSGQVARAYLGHPAVGDFDGDGNPELVLASYLGPELSERQVVAIESGGTGELGVEAVRFTVTGLATPAADAAGIAAGDVDGDGRADLLVGDYGNSPGRVLLFGSALVSLGGGLAPSDATGAVDGPALDDAFGAGLLALDVAGDSNADIIVGAPSYGDGAVYVVPSAF